MAFWQKDSPPLPLEESTNTQSSAASSKSSQSSGTKRSKSIVRRTFPVTYKNGHASIAAAASIQQANEVFPKRITGWFNQIMSNTTGPSPSTQRSSVHSSTSSSKEPSMGSSSLAQRLSSPLRSFSLAKPSSPMNGRQATDADIPHKKPALQGLDRILDRASNYFFDTDAQADKNPEDIWILGVRHPGWRPPNSTNMDTHSSLAQEADLFGPVLTNRSKRKGKTKAIEPSISPTIANGQDDGLPHIRSDRTIYKTPASSTSSLSLIETPANLSDSTHTSTATPLIVPPSVPLPSLAQTNGWPPSFFLDFTSRIQLTYRSNFPALPPPDSSPPSSSGSNTFQAMMGSLTASIGRASRENVHVVGVNGKGLTSDAGWGCMLRTGQSLLANALAQVHLGRGTFRADL